jgi:uncharacterized protein
MSDDLFTRAASTDKDTSTWCKGANHMQLYDGEKYVDEAASVLGPFFRKHLKA